MKIGTWEFQVDGENALYLSGQHQSQVLKLLAAWEREFPWEETWVRKETGKPSLVIRLDLAVQPDGSLGIYEIEERPAGMGISATLNEVFRGRLSNLVEKWQREYGPISIVISHRRNSGDDFVLENLMGVKVVKELPPEECWNHLFLVRANPDEKEYWDFAHRSISSLRSKGDKSYGLALGLWTRIPEDTNLLPWDKGFALKPKQGSKTKGITLWHPSKMKGTATRTRIEDEINSGRAKYVQGWIEPERHKFLPPNYYLIRRVFWGWDPVLNKWNYLGGNWNARPNVIIHGATDSIHGCVN